MSSKATVRIFGQEYTIVGEKSEADIRRIAEYVDFHMKEIRNIASDKSTLSLAVLSAVNITEDYFDIKARTEFLEEENNRLENENRHYSDVWERSKESTEAKVESIRELKERVKDDGIKFKELEEKCREYENSFFDLQMENIQIKSEIEKLKMEKRNLERQIAKMKEKEQAENDKKLASQKHSEAERYGKNKKNK